MNQGGSEAGDMNITARILKFRAKLNAAFSNQPEEVENDVNLLFRFAAINTEK